MVSILLSKDGRFETSRGRSASAKLKYDLAADDFCFRELFATEAAFCGLGRIAKMQSLNGQDIGLHLSNFAEVGITSGGSISVKDYFAARLRNPG